MTSKAGMNQNTQKSRSLGVHRSSVRLSPRSKWKRAVRKLDPKNDVDTESVPLTDKESLQRQNSIISTGKCNGGINVVHIPNVVPYDKNETSLTEDKPTNSESERYEKVALNEQSNTINGETTIDIQENTTPRKKSEKDNAETNLDLSDKRKDVIILTNDGPAVEITSARMKENGSPKLNGSVVNSEDSPKVPLSRIDNDVPLKESLTVPGTESISSGSKDAGSKSSNGSVFSFGRESSKVSIDSRKSVDPRIQYATVQMPADDKTKSSVFAPEESMIKTVIPQMPLGVAVTCLVMNIIIPGSGTILSGVTIFCRRHTRVPQKYDQDTILVMCLNTWVGVAQLFTVTFMLVGWFWSLAWGITMVSLSVERRRELKEERANELKKRALEAFGTSIPGRVSMLA